MSSILNALNTTQQDICRHINGPVLILAGAGSGKTRVLTHRIAHLIMDHGVSPRSILAVTFTNKAANEMKERVEGLLNQSARDLWIGTFHSICARLLRIEAKHIGFSSNFTIYDTADSINAVQQILKSLEVDLKKFTPKSIFYHISSWKDRMVTPEAGPFDKHCTHDQLAAYVYHQYDALLKTNNAMDFNDLITRPIQLFDTVPEVLQKYQQYFRYILVDEYQDTNHAQYQLVKRLSGAHHNLTVVGDEDQSIYKWRGADISNILNFERDFESAEVFRLEQNYRSTSTILQAANEVVKGNTERIGKSLWTENQDGEKITLMETDSDIHEADRVLEKVMTAKRSTDLSYADMVVLYRTNAQSRPLEDAFRRNGIAYQVIGGQKFYDRKEIKDVIAYLRVLVNPNDAVALRRIINVPARGIGASTEARLAEYANQQGVPVYEAMNRVTQIPTLKASAQKRVYEFAELLNGLRSHLDTLDAHALTQCVLDETGIVQTLELDGTIESQSRLENIQELLRTIREYNDRSEGAGLAQFLEEVQLLSDIDQFNDESDKITMMTVHSAKGLEFPLVFIVGLEEGLFPHENSIYEDNVEEERRLFYVGITRAERQLILSWAKRRARGYAQYQSMMRSSFLNEIPNHLLTVEGRPVERHHFQARKSQSDRVEEGWEYSQVENPIRVGAMVEHDMFGRGKVQQINGNGELAKVTVRFESGQSKKLIAKYANLKPLGDWEM